MADFISGVIGQLGRPTIRGNEFNQLANIGAEVIDDSQKKEQDLAAQYVGAMLSAKPEQRQMILNQGMDAGVFDEEHMGFASDFDQYAPQMASYLQVNGYEKLLPDSYRNNSKTYAKSGSSDPNLYQDEKGNLFKISMEYDPNNGQSRAIPVSVSERGDAQPVGSLSLASKKALTSKGDADAIKEVTTAENEAKAAVDLKNKPKLEAEIAKSKAYVADQVKIGNENRSNQSALNVYESAIGNFTRAFDETITGPFVGWSPALTSNQQVVEGSIAIMAPILKGVFRQAGEGTFTKDDQEILMAMLPTRKDKPKARASKLASVDSVIRAKLANKEVLTDLGVNPEKDAGGTSEKQRRLDELRSRQVK